MANIESGQNFEKLEKLTSWLEETTERWQSVPDFTVDSKRFKHLAIICDGNRRAAVERQLPPFLGHRVGIEVVKGIANCARRWDIRNITFWLWSTENWGRGGEQIDYIFYLSRQTLLDEQFINQLHTDQVRFTHLGRKDRMPKDIFSGIENVESQTCQYDKYRFNLGVDYGGLDEIGRAVNKLVQAGELLRNPEIIDQYLDTQNQPLVDLVIRTGSSSGLIHHLSGFMPLQTRQAGLVFLPDLFPNLTPQALLQPLCEYQDFEQRLGR